MRINNAEACFQYSRELLFLMTSGKIPPKVSKQKSKEEEGDISPFSK